MTEAEAVANKAEEELAVAKERLLLQENELQSKSGAHAQHISVKGLCTFVIIRNQMNHIC